MKREETTRRKISQKHKMTEIPIPGKERHGNNNKK
jgi:hypothetical protein